MTALLEPTRKFDASRVLDAYELIALGLARRLVEIGQAEAVEAQMVSVVDPLYDTMTNSTVAWRLVDFCDTMRRITGLPEVPKDRAADG